MNFLLRVVECVSYRRLFSIFSVILMTSFCNVPAMAVEIPAVDCVVTPSKLVDVSSPVPGTLAAVLVDRSNNVKKGQIIARLNSEVEQASVALAKAKAALDTEVNIEAVNLAFDKERANRLDKLYDVSMASSQDKDDAKRNMELSEEKLKQAKKLRNFRLLELRKAEAQLNEKIIRSPIQGIVVQRFKTESEHIEDQAIVRIAQINPLHVEAIVPIEYFGKISTNLRANVYSDTFPVNPQSAQVTVVDQMGDAASGTFGVRLELPNDDYKLAAGVKCNVQILSELPVQNVDNSTSTKQISRIENYSQSDDTLALDASINKLDSIENTPAAQRRLFSNSNSSDSNGNVSLSLPNSSNISSQTSHENISETRYIVLSTAQEDISQSQQLLSHLKDMGIKDIDLIWKGKYKQRISFGVFNYKDGYKSRIHDLAKQGIKSIAYKM